MTEHFNYKTISRPAIAEFKDRGSRFIAYSYPVISSDDCKEKLSLLKKEHPKAVHHCVAYRLGLDKNNFRASDDGEPSGSAGKPILGQIDSRELTNTIIIVVRYFGGTLLGVPGLINAYKTAAAMVLQLSPIVQKPVMIKRKINFNYPQMNDVMRIIKNFNCEIIEQELNLFCMMQIDIPKSKAEETITAFKDLRDVEINAAP